MRTFDVSPFYRSTVGFDRLFSLLDQATEGASNGYPPYNIERTGDNAYRITVAVAGFSEADLWIEAKENTLTIRGEKKQEKEQKDKDVYRSERHYGLVRRAFELPSDVDATSPRF